MTNLVSEPPTASPARDWSFPAVERSALDGLDVVAAHLPARPMVQVVLVLDAGATTDPTGREGVAAVLGDAVLRGAAGRDEHELAVAFERVGAVPGVAVRYDRAEVRLDLPGGLLGEALALVADVVRRPDLAAADIVEVRDARVDRLRARVNESGFRAQRAAPEALWTTDCRYRAASGGTVASLSAVEVDDVTALHQQRWLAGNHTLVLAGDLAGVDVAEVAAPLAAEMAPSGRGTTTSDVAAAGRRVALVEVPGAVQSALALRAVGPAFADGDDAALEVASAALFGTFGSRLNQRLREELGFTYGASGGFVRLRDGGWVQSGCSVRTEVTSDAVAELLGVLDTAVADGLDDDEVARARDNLAQRFPVRYDGPGAVAGALVRRVTYALSDDERDEHLAALRDVTASDATAALRTHLRLRDAVVAVAGDAEAVRDDLVAAGLGEVHDVE